MSQLLSTCTAETVRTVGRITGAFLAPVAGGPGGNLDPAQEERLRQAVWRLRRSFASLSEGGLDHKLVNLIRGLGARVDNLEAAVVAWVDVVEILVQEVEQQQGSAPGHGKEKKEKVEAALFSLMMDMSQRGGQRPSAAAILLFEAIADWSVDVVVLLVNRHELWAEPPPSPSWVRQMVMAIFWVVTSPLRWLGRAAANGISRLVVARHKVSPELAAAIGRIPSTGSLSGLFREGLEFLVWVGNHRDQVVAVVDIFSITVHEAEALTELSGPEKKIYARELVVIFLQEEGVLPPPSSPFTPLIEGVVGGMIEAVVTLFNKRRLFTNTDPGSDSAESTLDGVDA